MIANLHNAYFSEDIWDDPMAFKPERFIGENGQIQKLNCLMPFGVGTSHKTFTICILNCVQSN